MLRFEVYPFRRAVLVIGFSLLGLLFSGWSMLVHHRLLTRPGYVGPCSVNEVFNCSAAYLSRFGSVAGIPLAALGLVFFGGTVLLGGLGSRPTTDTGTPISSYTFALHDPTRGRILLNGTDIRQIRLAAYRRLLAIVQQDVFLFDGTVSDNIAYGRQEATAAAIEEAARLANAHEFIVRLPHQYATTIGERGVRLSGGQQQRLAIARAILANPQILILDEATSSLDTESEELIQASMGALLAGRTTFIIAHRLSTIRRANLILIMEDGRIVERGTHSDLMAAGGTYYRMVRRQADLTVDGNWDATGFDSRDSRRDS